MMMMCSVGSLWDPPVFLCFFSRSDRIRNVVWKDEVKLICDNILYKSGGMYHATASCICSVCWHYVTGQTDREGGREGMNECWITFDCAVHATNVWVLQRCLHSQVLFRLFPVEDTAVCFIIVLHASLFSSDMGQVMLSGMMTSSKPSRV